MPAQNPVPGQRAERADKKGLGYGLMAVVDLPGHAQRAVAVPVLRAYRDALPLLT